MRDPVRITRLQPQRPPSLPLAVVLITLALAPSACTAALWAAHRDLYGAPVEAPVQGTGDVR